MLLSLQNEKILPMILTPFATGIVPPSFSLPVGTTPENAWNDFKGGLKSLLEEIAATLLMALDDAELEQAMKSQSVYEQLVNLSGSLAAMSATDVGPIIIPALKKIIGDYAKDVLGLDGIRSEKTLSSLRSSAMQGAAADNAARWIGEQKGVWKVGELHIQEIKNEKNGDGYEVLTQSEFNADFSPWLLQNP